LDRFAYRIVQEALTNVLKHAGPGAHAEVRRSGEGALHARLRCIGMPVVTR
jgi:signal transduction histidine kinase